MKRHKTIVVFAALFAFLATGLGPATGLGRDQSKQQKKEQKRQEQAKTMLARAVCLSVTRFIQDGHNGYESLKGSRNYDKSDSKWVAYDSHVVMPGASSCIIFVDRFTGQKAFVSCTLPRPEGVGTDQESLVGWQKAVSTALNPCLPKDWTPIDDRRQHPAGYFLKGEGDPGPKIEIDFAKPGAESDLLVNFYPQ